MRPLFRRVAFSLRGKLLLFSVTLVVVPGVVFGVMTLSSTRRALERAVGRQLAEVAQDTATELSERVQREQATMHTWASQEVMREVHIGDIDKHVARFLATLSTGDTGFVELLCVDAAGRVTAATNPRSLGLDASAESWWHRVAAGRDYLAGPLRYETTGEAVLRLAVPIPDPEHLQQVQGGLFGLYDWERLTAILARIQRGLRRHKFRVDITVVDRDGLVIAEAPLLQGHSLMNQNLRQEGWRTAYELPPKEPGYWRDPIPDALVGFARVPSRSQWTVLVRQSLGEAFGAAYRLQHRLTLLLGGILCVAAGVALLFSERLSRPLRQLRRATRTLATTGANPRPIPVRSRDEIGALAHAFNQMSERLQKAQDDLITAAKFAFVGEVAAGVAHEVRTPLGILRSSAQLLRRSVKEKPRDIELIDIIVGEVDRLDRVVAQLLELARPREPIIETTPLGPLLGRALDFVQASAGESGITIARDLTAAMRPARCDPDQIYQVALNLIVNALQAMQPGGRLAVRTVTGGNGTVGFTVSDTGPGMTADVIERIFTPFYTRRQGGTGLGLAFVQRTVQAHRGKIRVESEVGRGTTFCVDLPAAKEVS